MRPEAKAAIGLALIATCAGVAFGAVLTFVYLVSGLSGVLGVLGILAFCATWTAGEELLGWTPRHTMYMMPTPDPRTSDEPRDAKPAGCVK